MTVKTRLKRELENRSVERVQHWCRCRREEWCRRYPGRYLTIGWDSSSERAALHVCSQRGRLSTNRSRSLTRSITVVSEPRLAYSTCVRSTTFKPFLERFNTLNLHVYTLPSLHMSTSRTFFTSAMPKLGSRSVVLAIYNKRPGPGLGVLIFFEANHCEAGVAKCC